MKWDKTIASQCRYGDIAEKVFGKWDIIWEDSEADYQGHATILGKKGRKYVFYEWWYGSCSGCDGWEADGKDDKAIEKEMKDTAMWFDGKKELKDWLDMLEGNPRSNANMERGGALAFGLDALSGGLLGRINGIRKELGMEEIKIKEEAE